MNLPLFTLDDYETIFADRHLLHGVVAKWAKARPDAPAILSAEGDRAVTWSDFDRITTALAGELLRLGFAKGDFLVTLLPLSVDHVLLEYSCFKIGVIVAPLDLRLSSAEVIRSLQILRPLGLVGLGVKAPFDFRELWRAVRAQCNWIRHSIVVDSEEEIPGTRSFASIAEPALRTVADAIPGTEPDSAALAEIASTVTENDGALVIFTTGSTGSPKPALLSHRNIAVQNMCLCGAFFGGDRGSRTLVNLPPSHVGGQTEAMMSTFFGGGTAVLLEVFDAGRSLRAITRHGVEILGQIPAMFQLEWMLKDYERHDLSSLRFAAYGGHAVSRPFMDQLAAMAPAIGTGLGLTEAAGFCTYTQASTSGRETLLAGLGQDMPIYPCSIRGPMRADSQDHFARRLFIYRRSWPQRRRGPASDRPGKVGDQVVWLPDISRRRGIAHLYTFSQSSQLRRGGRGARRRIRSGCGSGGEAARSRTEPAGTGSARAFLAVLHAASPLDRSGTRPHAAEPRGQAGLRTRPGNGPAGDRRVARPRRVGHRSQIKSQTNRAGWIAQARFTGRAAIDT
jgi:hypothetical protein